MKESKNTIIGLSPLHFEGNGENIIEWKNKGTS